MNLPQLVTAPVKTPVTLAEAKAHLRVDITDDDTLINGLINAATDYLDGYSGILKKALITQTWSITAPCFKSNKIYLNLDPVSSVTSIQYYDADNVQQTINAANYALYKDAGGSYIKPTSGNNWPAVYNRDDAVVITFAAGYGADESAVPNNIRQAIFLLIAHWYENREAVVVGSVTPSELPMAFNALLAGHRTIEV